MDFKIQYNPVIAHFKRLANVVRYIPKHVIAEYVITGVFYKVLYE